MTLIYSSKTSAKVRRTSNAFRIMKKNTSASAKRLKWVLSQTEKEKKSKPRKSLSKSDETKLPKKEDFYSKLNDSHISAGDYEHAEKIWNEFEMNTIGDYYDLYLKSDVLLLADVFEEFRSVCLENYKLDPAWYFTAPGLAWDAALKESKVELELLNDIDMLLMIEKGTRGGISMISN